MDNNEKFEYTYSAKQQAELENIRKKYLPKEETKMEKLRRLDKSVTSLGTVISIAIGIIGTLIMGFGMCLVMVWSEFFIGIIIGIFGMAVIGAAYPIFNYITKKRREKIAPEILRLTEEIELGNFSEE
ncbi:MAG: hypothetical protein NC452_08475 [Eubacterium sp.]|nr:hypothetical protein [Eubacterium sp.]